MILSDGATGSGATVTHTYPNAGSYTAVVTAANSVNTITATTTVTLTGSGPVTVTRSITYTYDGLHRLTGATYSTGESYAYQYDAVGNRVAMTDTTGTTTYTYDAANRLTSIELPDSSVQTYTWDARGNLLSTGAFTYTYDAAGRMVRAETLAATVVYTYTVDGLRIAQDANGIVTPFAWDWATGVPELLTDGNKLYLVGHDTLGWEDTAGWTYAVPDALGSMRQVTDGDGAVVDAREWTPYGVEAGEAQAGLGYTGEWWDGAMGLQYLRARWYDAYLNHFTSPDDIIPDYRQPGSLNRYTYASGNPINLIDPSGESGVDAQRAQMLHDYALELHYDTGLMAMRKFLGLLSYASSLYNDYTETSQFVSDVTAVVHGHEYDPSNGLLFFMGASDNSSSYFVGQGKFDQPGYYDEQSHTCTEGCCCNDVTGDCQDECCDLGWQERYRDNTGNQAYHFWFYVATAYFDNAATARFGNWFHETTESWIKRVMPTSPVGPSQQDYDLGVQGAHLGSRLANWAGYLQLQRSLQSPCPAPNFEWALMFYPSAPKIRPSEVPAWVGRNVAGPSIYLPMGTRRD